MNNLYFHRGTPFTDFSWLLDKPIRPVPKKPNQRKIRKARRQKNK